jgi:hypothetical protein
MRVEDQIVLVASVAQEQGATTAPPFAREGAAMFACDVDLETHETTAVRIGKPGEGGAAKRRRAPRRRSSCRRRDASLQPSA